jgi:hypothetical protein
VARKAAAQVAAKKFMESMQEDVLTNLQTAGHLYDPVTKQVDAQFMPWLLQRASVELERVQWAREEVEAIVVSAVRMMNEEVAEKVRRDAAAAEAARVAREAEEARVRAEAAAKEAAVREEKERVEREERERVERERAEEEREAAGEAGEEEEKDEDIDADADEV